MLTAIIVSDESTLLAAAESAKRHGMALFTNGERAVISPVKPSRGLWAEVKIRVINPQRAHAQVMPWNA